MGTPACALLQEGSGCSKHRAERSGFSALPAAELGSPRHRARCRRRWALVELTVNFRLLLFGPLNRAPRKVAGVALLEHKLN